MAAETTSILCLSHLFQQAVCSPNEVAAVVTAIATFAVAALSIVVNIFQTRSSNEQQRLNREKDMRLAELQREHARELQIQSQLHEAQIESAKSRAALRSYVNELLAKDSVDLHRNAREAQVKRLRLLRRAAASTLKMVNESQALQPRLDAIEMIKKSEEVIRGAAIIFSRADPDTPDISPTCSVALEGLRDALTKLMVSWNASIEDRQPGTARYQETEESASDVRTKVAIFEKLAREEEDKVLKPPNSPEISIERLE